MTNFVKYNVLIKILKITNNGNLIVSNNIKYLGIKVTNDMEES